MLERKEELEHQEEFSKSRHQTIIDKILKI